MFKKLLKKFAAHKGEHRVEQCKEEQFQPKQPTFSLNNADEVIAAINQETKVEGKTTHKTMVETDNISNK